MADITNNLKGLVTNEGLNKSIEALENRGWKIYPQTFAISEFAGAFSVERTINDLNTTWYEAPISSVVKQGSSVVELICTVPPQMTDSNKLVKEIYIKAKDRNDADFLLCFAQTVDEIEYYPNASLTFRLIININNIDVNSIYEFNYTQATEIHEHNSDPNAHEDIRNMIINMGNAVLVNKEVFMALPSDVLYVDTSNYTTTIHLPTRDLKLGSYVTIIDSTLHADEHPITIRHENKKIDNEPVDFVIDNRGGSVKLIFYPNLDSWLIDVEGRFGGPQLEEEDTCWLYSKYFGTGDGGNLSYLYNGTTESGLSSSFYFIKPYDDSTYPVIYPVPDEVIMPETGYGAIGSKERKWNNLVIFNIEADNIKCNNSVLGSTFTTENADLAELYYWNSSEEPAPGTVVKLDESSDNPISVVPVNNLNDTAFGVISTKPGVVLGNEKGPKYVPIALIGRVPVYVVGAVNKGDKLICGFNGTALANKNGHTENFGIALETSEDQGKKLVLAVMLR